MYVPAVHQELVTHNGRGFVASGPMGQDQLRWNWDPGYRRPYFDKHGRPSVTINTGRWTTVKGEKRPLREHRLIRDLMNQGVMSPVFNATTLRKEEWLELDRVVRRAARYRLRAWADLAANSSFGGFNGMAKMILEHETMTDPGEAIVDMTGTTEGRGDRPKFQLEGLPLPITHSEFTYSARELAESRNTGTPLDTNMGEASGRRVAEAIEKTTIGVQTGLAYGGSSTLTGGYGRTSQVYGYVNFPPRLTKTGYKPTGTGSAGSGWVPADTINDVLAALDQLRAGKFYGPYVIYHSNDWDRYLDKDYILTGGNVATQTLRQRLMTIGTGDGYEGSPVIQGVRRLDFLFGSLPSASTGPGGENVSQAYPFVMLIVQMTPDVARAVNGMDITTLQWETKGGMELNFRVMAIQVPQLFADAYSNCGILHMTSST